MSEFGAGHALIIEDDLLIALDLESMLVAHGFATVDMAADPQEALNKARCRRPDLVTADFRICNGTGVQAVEAIRAELGQVPVIYVTGNIEAVQLAHGEAAVEKPIDERRLVAAFQRVGALSEGAPGLTGQ